MRSEDGSLRSIGDEETRRVLAAIDRDETVDFLRRLVRVPSVNPPGDVRAAVALCEEPLREAGFSVRTVGIAEAKPNLIAELGDKGGPSLCFNAHLDVVPTGELAAWTHRPFSADLVEGRVYGRGAGDDKASVTAQVMAGLALARSGARLRGRLIVNAVADEEIGGRAGAALMIDGGHIQPDFVIVGEQTRNRVCVGEKGIVPMRVSVRGRAAHGALPWEGANAVEGMGLIIGALRGRLWPQLEHRTHPYFQHSSASINMIEGGVKQNVVPDLCVAQIDRRLIPGEVPNVAVAEVANVAREAVAGLDGMQVTVESDGEARAATMNDPSSPVVQAMLAANRYLGLSTELTGFSMASDGRFFAAAGYPTIIYGPGDPRLAHVPDEWVGVEEVLEATRAYALAGLALLG